MGLKDFFKSLASSKAGLPFFIHIPNANIDDNAGLEGVFEPKQHYFTVRVNEMFLSQKRKWFREIEPSVICLSSYIYGEQEIDNPFVVGRTLIESKMQNVSEGLVFNDTRIAGIHPYAGGRLTLCMVLCQAVTKNYLADTLEFIEKVTGVFNENIRALTANYLKIANVVIGGIDKLMDAKMIEPLFGFRMEFDRDANDKFSPGYYAMIDKSEKSWNQSDFYVRQNRLFYGSSPDKLKPFREDEYMLFSVTRSDTRSDINLLPVWQSYKKILDMLKVSEVTQEQKDKIKGMLRILNIELRQSPDLAEPQARMLINQYIDEVGKMMEPKFNWGAAPPRSSDYWATMDNKIEAL